MIESQQRNFISHNAPSSPSTHACVFVIVVKGFVGQLISANVSVNYTCHQSYGCVFVFVTEHRFSVGNNSDRLA